ncbi:tetratricopeptide repeat protein [Cryptosporangium phraense]|uniref:Tetratricopeptide repeat protein n=1 Tax=Cryptosporangium phraense TaxID=2593070 RepID=A0A545AYJ0_9ACTN|nr:tetratricopeptide repeat protein [Cryptosporangium phraense]TQS46407.1 tetratricopeptide repeat protein [Cryptosporangium phraense]
MADGRRASRGWVEYDIRAEGVDKPPVGRRAARRRREQQQEEPGYGGYLGYGDPSEYGRRYHDLEAAWDAPSGHGPGSPAYDPGYRTGVYEQLHDDYDPRYPVYSDPTFGSSYEEPHYHEPDYHYPGYPGYRAEDYGAGGVQGFGGLLAIESGSSTPTEPEPAPTPAGTEIELRDQVRSALPVPETLAEARGLLFAPTAVVPVGLASEWLRPEARIVPTQPRPEVDDLVAWATQADRGPVLRLLCGAGGQGKTHAAQQVCARLEAQGWLAGFVHLPPANWRSITLDDLEYTGPDRPHWEQELRRAGEVIAGIRSVARLRTPTLLVVDQAESVGPLVGELLATIDEYDAAPWIRVLLLARSPDGWFTDLSEAHRLRSWVSPNPVSLGSLPSQLGSAEATAVWRAAVAAFANRAVSDGVLPRADLERLTSPPPAGLWPTTLDFYADAALRVLDATAPALRRHTRRDGGGPDPVAGVLAYERRQVSAVLTAAGCAIEDGQRDWAMAVVSLLPAASPEAAVRALRTVPAPWQVPPDRRADVAMALARLYRGTAEAGWSPPRPARLADAHLLDLAGSLADPEWSAVISDICGELDPLAALHAASALIRCLSAPTPSRRQERAKNRISVSLPWLLQTAPHRYAQPLTLLAPERYTKAIGDLLAVDGVPAETVQQLDSLVLSIGYTPSRATIAAALSERLVAAAYPGHDGTPEQLSEYARCLNNLGIRLSALGHTEDALQPAEDAVAVQRGLAMSDSTYLPDLAMSLDLLSTALADAGRPDEALPPAEEAVVAYRRLAAQDSVSYLPELATALNTLGIRLTEVGRRDAALDPVEEAVAVCRRLAVIDRATYQPELAFSLMNLSITLADLERWEESIEPAEEAVAVYRRLVAADSVGHLSQLALALNNLGNRLAETGRRLEALEPAEEAVSVYRRLVASNSTAYLPNLAASLNNLGIRLAEAGRQQEALTPVEEAVEVYRRLAETEDSYLSELALSLHNLGNRLVRLGRPDDALSPVAEAIEIRRHLAAVDPNPHLPDLARSLAAASATMGAIGRVEEAAEAAAEAVEVLEATPSPRRSDDTLLMAAIKIRDDAYSRLEADEDRALTQTTTTVRALGWGAGQQVPPHPRRRH